ncbi:helix-turn-helix domain-containing protein [Clostridium ganghwense]|uniref:Helix-turn-helix transcriptional regulator n=1 Tax=Clostridium ganghwense TaxID=312089 RepID=A0ABT4CTL5_9CLOT|nr:helix-turn-helix transcriptional regulator [Clostridium ganghwense]MCY6372413.1 helix-turn-helix transcriptional regulator [Clostridium ganghwense]
MKTLGQLISKYRETYNLSLREFAKLCDVSHSYIDKLEKGVDPYSKKKVEPTLDTIEKIAQAMNMSLEHILYKIGKIDTHKKERFEKAESLKDELKEMIIRRGIVNNEDEIDAKLLDLIEHSIKTYAKNTDNVKKEDN